MLIVICERLLPRCIIYAQCFQKNLSVFLRNVENTLLFSGRGHFYMSVFGQQNENTLNYFEQSCFGQSVFIQKSTFTLNFYVLGCSQPLINA